MLYNLPLLNNLDLMIAFMNESKKFMDGLNKKLPHNELNEIHQSLKKVFGELDRRRENGEMKDC